MEKGGGLQVGLFSCCLSNETRSSDDVHTHFKAFFRFEENKSLQESFISFSES